MTTATAWTATRELVKRDLSTDDGPGETTVVRVSCWVGQYRITAERDLLSPADGPERLSIQGMWDVEDAGGLVGPWSGITTETLRSLPMSEIRQRLAALVREALLESGDSPPVPARVDSVTDLARFAAVYANLVEQRYTRPLHRLSELSGVPRNTLSARIRRAREQGLLTRPAAGLAGGELTAKARDLLSASGEG